MNNKKTINFNMPKDFRINREELDRILEQSSNPELLSQGKEAVL
jgi:DNA-binding phage protein